MYIAVEYNIGIIHVSGVTNPSADATSPPPDLAGIPCAADMCVFFFPQTNPDIILFSYGRVMTDRKIYNHINDAQPYNNVLTLVCI